MKRMAFVVITLIGTQLGLARSLPAFSVGNITVHSRHGAPFAAEVRLTLEPHEQHRPATVALGSLEDYQSENLKRLALVDHLRAGFAPGRFDLIRLTSATPVSESVFDLLLLVRIGHVTVVQNYHVALPTPPPPPARAYAPLATVMPVATRARPAPARKPVQPAQPASTPQPTQWPERYGPVSKGETLYGVVKSLRAPGDKLWQAVVLIWRANKEQFLAGNIHALSVGAILQIPPDLAENLSTLSTSEAQELVSNQWEEWQTLQRSGGARQRMIVAAREAAPTEADRSAREAITLPAEKPAPQAATVVSMDTMTSGVNKADLQTMIQGLEERIMRRLTPTTPEFKQELKSPTSFVNAAELEVTLQSLEERLTQRVQQLIAQQGTTPVQIGQLATQTPPPPRPTSPTPQTGLQTPGSWLSYVLMFGNGVLLALGAIFAWLWLRRRGREARPQGV